MTEPTDAELDTILTDVVGSDDMHDHWLREIGRPIARAVLAKWGQPAQAAEPVAWLRNTTDPQPHAVTNLKYRSAVDAEAGVEYIPVFAAPQPVQAQADGFFLLLPQRPKPEAPAGTAGLDWAAYSGAQMLAFGRDCSDAAIAALRTEQPAPATQQAGVALSDDLRDRLVAISEAIADQDDRAAQAMLREILKAPQPSPAAQAAESRTIPDREIPGIVERALQELEGLVKYATSTYGHWDMRRAKGALSDLEWWARRKLAAHAQAAEPVAWYEYNGDLDAWFLAYIRNPKAKTRPLVFGDTAPQPVERVPLTDEQIKDGHTGMPRDVWAFADGVRFAEQHHGIKGGQHGTE